MALQKTAIQIPLTVLDEGTDDKMLPDGSFTLLENARFDKQGRISKRDGYVSLTTGSDDANEVIQSGSYLLSSKDSLMLFDGKDSWIYRSGSIAAWDKINPYIPVAASTKSVYASSKDKVLWDACSTSNAQCFLYSENDIVNNNIQSGSFALFSDKDNDIVLNDVMLNPKVTTNMRCASFTSGSSDFIGVVYTPSDGKTYWQVYDTNGQQVTAETEIPSGYTLDPVDVIALSDDRILVVCVDTITVTINGMVIDKNGTQKVANTSLGISTDEFIAVVKHYSTDNWFIATHSSSTVTIYEFNSSLTLQTTSVSQNTSDVPSALILTWMTVGGAYKLLLGRETEAETLGGVLDALANDILFFAWSEDLSSVDYATFARIYGGYFAANFFTRTEFGEVVPYISIAHRDEVQESLFIGRISPDNIGTANFPITWVAKLMIGELIGNARFADSSISFHHPPKCVDPTNAQLGLLKKRIDKIVDQTSIYQAQEIVRVSLDFDPHLISKEYNNSVFIPGGYLRHFDSWSIRPSDFPNYPPKIRFDSTVGTGGSLADGVYQYLCVYQLMDANGNIIRSAPSIPLSVTVSSGTGTARNLIDYFAPNFMEYGTDPHDPFDAVEIRLYRTTAGGSIFYLIDNVDVPTIPGRKEFSYSDGLADANITDENTVYTTGGELENITTSSCEAIEVYKNRLFIAGSDDPRKLYFSKEIIQNESPGFYSDLSKTWEYDIQNIGTLGDKLYVFGTDRIAFITGDGPDSLGQNDRSTSFIDVSNEIGSINKKAFIVTDIGIFFQSRRGLYLLTKSEELIHVGSQIEDTLDAGTINKAIVLPSLFEVRFLLDNNKLLVYNYEFNKWNIHTGFSNLSDMETRNNKTYLLQSNGIVLEETDGTFTDNGSIYSLKMTTGWISLGQINQLKRIYDFYILGNYKSAHTLNVEIAYNNDDTVVDTKTWSTANGLVDGDTMYQIRVRPSVQKCDSMKVTIYDSSQSGTNESFSINGITIIAGMKGTNRQIKQVKNM